jgi:hypothetical protein
MSAVLYAIPAGTRSAVCSAASCRKTIYWILTGAKKRMPIDVNVPDGKAPTDSEPGQGVPHWGTCSEAKSFKKKGAA